MAEVTGDGPLSPRHPDLRPPPEDPNRPDAFAHRRDTREPAPVPPDEPPKIELEALAPKHPPGAPERLEREAVQLERRAAWTMLATPPLVTTAFVVDPFGLLGVLMGLGANVVAIVAAYRNRGRFAREAAGFAALAYGVGVVFHLFVAPWVVVAFVPLGLGIRWLGRAGAHRREAWRLVWSARQRSQHAATRRRDQLRGVPGAGDEPGGSPS